MSDESIKKPSSVVPSDFLFNHERGRPNGYERKEDEEKNNEKKDEAQGHFRDLKVMVERANEHLARDNAPFRFGLDRQEDEIIIDIMKVDDNGEVVSVVKKNITHEGFMETHPEWGRFPD